MSHPSRQACLVLLLVPILALMCHTDTRPAGWGRVMRALSGERAPVAAASVTAPAGGRPDLAGLAPAPETWAYPEIELGVRTTYAPEFTGATWEMPPLMVPVGSSASLRPVGAPYYLPGDFSGAGGVTGGLGVALDPNSRWRLGVDLVVRAEGWDERYRPEVLSTFLIPGVEYMVNPQAAAPVSVGVITPVSIGDTRAGSGVFFFVRWDELFGKPSRRR